jgi:hypothetical protein
VKREGLLRWSRCEKRLASDLAEVLKRDTPESREQFFADLLAAVNTLNDQGERERGLAEVAYLASLVAPHAHIL